MRKQDYAIAGGLCLLAAFIWLRDLAWITSSDDTLPILAALPVFVCLGAPWVWLDTKPVYSTKLLVAAVCLFVGGIALNFTLMLSIGWVLLLCTWLTQRLPAEKLPSLYKLLPLPLIAFPWIALDFNRLGWWFRLSGAWVAEGVFHAAGFYVEREGTLMTINGLPVSIEAACAGLNTLQSMLISGTLAAYILLNGTRRYWLTFPLMFVMAWASNTLRIIIICLLALLISPQFVMGPFHVWGGWGVLMLMFGLCWLVFSWMEPKNRPLA